MNDSWLQVERIMATPEELGRALAPAAGDVVALWQPARAGADLRSALWAAPAEPVPSAPGAVGAVRATAVTAEVAEVVRAAWGRGLTSAVVTTAPLRALAVHLGAFTAWREPQRAPRPLDLSAGARLAGLLPSLDAREVGALFGGAAIREADGATRASCPACGAPAGSAGCAAPECGWRAGTSGAGFLVSRWLVAEGDALLVFEPGAGAVRRRRRGRPGLQLRPELLAAFGCSSPALPPRSIVVEVDAPRPRVLVDLDGGEATPGTRWSDGRQLWLLLDDGRELRWPGPEVRRVRELAGPPRPPAPWPLERERVASAADLLPGAPLRAWALLHGPSMPEGELDDLRDARRLDRGRPGPEDHDRGVYLVPMPAERPAAQALLDGVAQGWGALLHTSCPEEPLLHHLRGLRLVTDARDGRTLRFRLAEPRTLAVWLETVDGDDVAQLFGASAWRDGRSCPVCATPVAGPRCEWCDATFDAAGLLLTAIALRGVSGELELVRAASVGRAPERRGPERARLRVRPDQLDALGDDLARRRGAPGLEAPLLERARELVPNTCAARGDDRVRALAREAIERAAGYGIRGLPALQRWFELLLLVDPDVDRGPSRRVIREALRGLDEPAEERVERAWALATSLEAGAPAARPEGI